MSEMGPALTSPTQFEMMLPEEDGGEDTSSESSRLYSSFPSSPLAIQADVAELTSPPEAPTSRFIHRSSGRPHRSLEVLHRSTGHLPPQNSTCASTTFLPRRRSGQPSLQHHVSEPPTHPFALHHGASIQGDCGSFEDDYTLWDCTSTGIQPRTGSFHRIHVPSGQLQHTIPEWQFANAQTQSSVYPLQANPSSYPGSGYLFQPSQADDRTQFIPTTSPSFSHRFTIPLCQQNAGIDSSWNHDSSITMIPGIVHPRNPTISQWPSGSIPPNPPFLEPLQNSELSLDPRVFYHLVSDHHRNLPHSEVLLGTFTHAEGCTLLSLDEAGDDNLRGDG